MWDLHSMRCLFRGPSEFSVSVQEHTMMMGLVLLGLHSWSILEGSRCLFLECIFGTEVHECVWSLVSFKRPFLTNLTAVMKDKWDQGFCVLTIFNLAFSWCYTWRELGCHFWHLIVELFALGFVIAWLCCCCWYTLFVCHPTVVTCCLGFAGSICSFVSC